MFVPRAIKGAEARTERVSCLMEPGVLRVFQSKCSVVGISMSEAINRLVSSWIGGETDVRSPPLAVLEYQPVIETVSLEDMYSDVPAGQKLRGLDFLLNEVIGEETDETVMEAIRASRSNL